MAIVILKYFDPRIGEINAGGVQWPETDVYGKAYEKVNATLHQIGAGRFVVIPPNGWEQIDSLTVEPPPPIVVDPPFAISDPPVVEGDTPAVGTVTDAKPKK